MVKMGCSKFNIRRSCRKVLSAERSALCVLRGLGLLEVVIASALIFLSVTGVVAGYSFFIKKGFATTPLIQASYLLEEGLEAVTFLRDRSWSSFSSLPIGTTQYLLWNGYGWVATSTPQSIGEFSRSFSLANVYRDGSDNIAASGTLDTGTRKVTVTVSYASTTRSISTYLANILE